MTVTVYEGDNLDITPDYPDGSFTVVYLDPPFNTGRTRERETITVRRPRDADGELDLPDGDEPDEKPVIRRGFHGAEYERIRATLRSFDDSFDLVEPVLLLAGARVLPEVLGRAGSLMLGCGPPNGDENTGGPA